MGTSALLFSSDLDNDALFQTMSENTSVLFCNGYPLTRPAFASAGFNARNDGGIPI